MKQTNSENNNKYIVKCKLSQVSAVQALPNSFDHLLVEALLHRKEKEQVLGGWDCESFRSTTNFQSKSQNPKTTPPK